MVSVEAIEDNGAYTGRVGYAPRPRDQAAPDTLNPSFGQDLPVG